MLLIVTSVFIFYLHRNIAKRRVKVDTHIFTICHSAKKAYVMVIEACRKTVYVLSQLTCINTYPLQKPPHSIQYHWTIQWNLSRIH